MISTLLSLVFAYFIYRHASGRARYNRVLIVIMMILSLFTGFIAAFVGYMGNPNKDNMRFRDVL